MKTLTELKRTIKAGSRVFVVSHWRDAVREDQAPMAGTIRVVTKTQGNGYWYEQNGHSKRLWADYPTSAKDIRFTDEGFFAIRFGDKGEAVFKLEVA